MRSQIVRFLLNNGPSTCGEIAAGLQASPSTIRRQLNFLGIAGLVQRASNQFTASHENVQRQTDDFAATFHCPVMQPDGLAPMN
jgi:predicted ArsR family transcriptional regulator